MLTRSKTIGIAMCTCNGIAFLDSQLRSLTDQSRLPDQIVVCDDCSDDGTWEYLLSWAERVQSTTSVCVLLLRNEKRLGVTSNFEKAIRALGTEIIFLADQDDVWLHDKIAILAAHLEADHHVTLVHSDAKLIDEEGRNLGRTLFQSLFLTRVDRELAQEGRFFEIYCRRNLVTGTATAFRRQLLEVALPFPEEWVHDEWLAACAAAWNAVAMVPDQLTLYRQHGRNAIGVPTSRLSRLLNYIRRVLKFPRDQYLARKIARFAVLRQRMEEKALVREDAITLLTEAELHFRRRSQFSRHFTLRLASVALEARAGGYRRFADGPAGMLRDLVHL